MRRRARNRNGRRQGDFGGRARAVQINMHESLLPQISGPYRGQGCLLLCGEILLLA
ncbi:septation protein A, partial [Pseudomonas ogarae]